ncbi:MAG: CLI_3235 family bacteriocin precursor [Spirochaetales bacterium]|nr:CLI_3235 family bacteriocin precursor [Spirochaetales bacterium]
MKKLSKKFASTRETIEAYASCYCYCGSCTCNCPIYYAQYSISSGMSNTDPRYRVYAVTNVNSY